MAKSMSTRKTKRILIFLFTLTFAIGSLMMFGTFIASFTLCKSSYMSKFICSPIVEKQLDETYERRIEALSKECGIPTEVFSKAKDDIAESDNISIRFYKGYETSLYSTDKVDTVVRYCKEYLNATDAQYTRSQINAVAEKAISIYDETYGLDNVQDAYGYVQSIQALQSKIYSSALILMFGSALATVSFCNKKVDRQKALISLFNATAFTFVLVPLLCLIFGIGTHVKISPSVYASAVANAVRGEFVLLLIIGLALTVVSVYFSPKILSKVAK